LEPADAGFVRVAAISIAQNLLMLLTMSVTDELPLLDLFTRLREAGLPLGVGEYQLLLRALQGGFGVADEAALKRLCQALWVKSTEDNRLFEYHFKQVMAQVAVSIAIASSVRTLPL
jgi:hypothetical protein